MDILNRDKLKAVLEKWKGHPSITDLFDRFDKLQNYTKKKLEKEFKSVERSYIPINSVIRIDEVVESGEAKIKQPKSQVAPTPINIHPANK